MSVLRFRECLVIAAVSFTPVALAGEPVQLKPGSVVGEWEIVARYNIVDNGQWRIDRRDEDTERISIAHCVLSTFRLREVKPSESYDIKMLRVADDGIGVIEISNKANAMEALRVLYRFRGDHLQLCVHDSMEHKQNRFAAKGTVVLDLMPYQQNRVVTSGRQPMPAAKQIQVPAPQPPPKKAPAQ